MSGDETWIVYDPAGDGMREHATQDAAVDDARDLIGTYCDDVWDEQVEEIVVARVTHQAQKVVLGRRAEMDDDAWCSLTAGADPAVDEWWDYIVAPLEPVAVGDVEVELVMNEYDYWWPEVHDTPTADPDDEHSGHVYRTVPAWIARAWEEAYERSERARTALLTAAGVADNESVRDPDEPVQAPEPCACWTGAMVPGWTRASVILPYDGSPAGGYAVFTGRSEDEARAYLRSLPRRFVLHSRFTPGGSLRRARRKDLRIEVEGRDPWPGLCPTCLWPRDRHASWVLAPHLGGEA